MEIKHFISHRGNLNGEEPEYENTTDYINNALSKGFECEIDVWFVKNEFTHIIGCVAKDDEEVMKKMVYQAKQENKFIDEKFVDKWWQS